MHPVRKRKTNSRLIPDRLLHQDFDRASQKSVGWSEKTGKRMDTYAAEDLAHVSTYAERERSAKT